MSQPRTNEKERFLACVEKTDTCWLWKTALVHDGYGRFMNYNQKGERAHRASYRMFVGKIPKGRVVMHTCDVRNCVNPEHLRIGTHADNMRDKKEKDRTYKAHGTSNHFAKLTDSDVFRIRELAKTQTHQSIADQFNVSQPTVTDIVNRRTWKHLAELDQDKQ